MTSYTSQMDAILTNTKSNFSTSEVMYLYNDALQLTREAMPKAPEYLLQFTTERTVCFVMLPDLFNQMFKGEVELWLIRWRDAWTKHRELLVHEGELEQRNKVKEELIMVLQAELSGSL